MTGTKRCKMRNGCRPPRASYVFFDRQFQLLEPDLTHCKQSSAIGSNRHWIAISRSRPVRNSADFRAPSIQLGLRSTPEGAPPFGVGRVGNANSRIQAFSPPATGWSTRVSTRQSCRVELLASGSKQRTAAASTRQDFGPRARNSAGPRTSRLEASKWIVGPSSALELSR